MQVVVKRSALVTALEKIISENRTGESGRIDDIMRDAASGEEPIEATEQMATQLSVDMPDVSDSDFMPVNADELSRSAYVIANAVPADEIEWFYRKLHEILDAALDRASDVSEVEEEEIEEEINESVIKRVVSLLIEQPVEDDDDFEYSDEQYEEDLLKDPASDLGEFDTQAYEVALAVSKFANGKRMDAIKARMSISDIGYDEIVEEYPYIFFDQKGSEYFGLPRNIQVAQMVLNVINNVQSVRTVYDSALKSSGKIEDQFKREILSSYRDLLKSRTGETLELNAKDMSIMSANLIFDFVTRAVKEIDPSLPIVQKGQAYMAILRPAQGSSISKSLADIMIKYSSGDFKDVESEITSIANSVAGVANLKISLPGMGKNSMDVPGKMLSDALLDVLKVKSEGPAAQTGPLYGDEYTEEIDTSGIEELLDIDPEIAAAKLKTLSALAPIFGKASASGFRQEAMKFPWAIFDVVAGGESQRELSLAEYSNSVFKNLRRLAEKVSEIIAHYSYEIEEDLEEDMEKAASEGRDVDPLIEKDFEIIQKIDNQLNDLKSSGDPAGAMDSQMILDTMAGHILRRIFRQNFYHTTFVDYAREMKKHMTKLLQGEGLAPDTVRYFSKMFNGEVVLEPYRSDKKKMKDAIAAGLTKDIYDRAIKEKIKFHKLFFSEDSIAKNTERFEKFIRNPEKLAAAFTEAAEKGGDWLKIEIEHPQLKIDDPSFIVETKFKKIISRMI